MALKIDTKTCECIEREVRCCNRYCVYVGLLYLYFGLRQCPGEQERVLDSIWWDPLGFIGDPLGFAGIRTKNANPPEDFSFFTEDPGLPSSCENSLAFAGIQ